MNILANQMFNGPWSEKVAVSARCLASQSLTYGSVALSFRKRGSKFVSEYSIKWMSGSTKRQCDRALASPSRRRRRWR
jgi:hypothetical protein